MKNSTAGYIYLLSGDAQMGSYGSNAQVGGTKIFKDLIATKIPTPKNSDNVSNETIQMNEKILVSLIKFFKTTRGLK